MMFLSEKYTEETSSSDQAPTITDLSASCSCRGDEGGGTGSKHERKEERIYLDFPKEDNSDDEEETDMCLPPQLTADVETSLLHELVIVISQDMLKASGVVAAGRGRLSEPNRLRSNRALCA
jgi:hypothetical protein